MIYGANIYMYIYTALQSFPRTRFLSNEGRKNRWRPIEYPSIFLGEGIFFQGWRFVRVRGRAREKRLMKDRSRMMKSLFVFIELFDRKQNSRGKVVAIHIFLVASRWTSSC